MKAIDDKIKEGIKEGVSPGGALLVASGDKILYEGAFGSASIVPKKEPLNIEILFDIASLTKAVCTATVYMVLRHECGVSVDTPVAKFFPSFNEEEKKRITIRQLLKHTSGLPSWRPYFEEMIKEAPQLVGTRRAGDVIVEKISQEAQEYPPAYRRVYSDLGFILLGKVAEKITGVSLDLFFSDKVARPLGLAHTFFRPPDDPSPLPDSNFVATEKSERKGETLRGEVHDDNAYVMGGVAGHAGLFQNVKDCHRFVVELIKAERGDSDWLPKEVVHEFIGPAVKLKLGWDTPGEDDSQAGRYFSKSSIGHLGFSGCSMWIDIEKGFHVIFFTNRIHPSSRNEKIKEFRPQLHDLVYETFFSS